MVSDEEKGERDFAHIRAAKSFNQFSGKETLIFGLRLSSVSMNIVQEVVKKIIDDDWRRMKARS